MAEQDQRAFGYGDLCVYRRAGTLDGQVVRITRDTGRYVGTAVRRLGKPAPEPTPEDRFYDTEPAVHAGGALGRYLKKVTADFGSQMAAYIDDLAHDAAILNHPELILGKTGRLTGETNFADVRAPVNTLLPWSVSVNGEEIAEVTKPFNRQALRDLAEIVRRRVAPSHKLLGRI